MHFFLLFSPAIQISIQTERERERDRERDELVQIMKDPVKAEDGFTYDRQHLEQVRNTFNISPFPLQYPKFCYLQVHPFVSIIINCKN